MPESFHFLQPGRGAVSVGRYNPEPVELTGTGPETTYVPRPAGEPSLRQFS
jgi:hypothetical protein